MSCSPFDLRDYVFDELGAAERRRVEEHAGSCPGCREELDRLKVTQVALSALGDEEIPQRIGFVSDRIFEPSPWRRWWGAFWGSSARLGFASAAMLSVAILVSAFTRPAPAPPAQAAPVVDTAAIEARFNGRLQAALAQAAAGAEARERERTRALLAEMEQRHEFQLKSMEVAVDETLSRLEKRYGNLSRYYVASLETGVPR